MARFEDYRDRGTALEDEIDHAGAAAEQRQAQGNAGFELPEKFRGKSAEEIAASYAELEGAYSRQGSTLGEQRKLMDELIAAQLRPSQSTEPEQVEPVSMDDLYEDPEGAIARVVNKSANKRIEELEQKLARTEYDKRFESFESKHPNWRQTSESPEFLEWLRESSYRTRLAAAAQQSGDVDAAEDLFTMYTDTHGGGKKSEPKRKVSNRNIADVSLEGTSAGGSSAEQTFSRSKLMETRIAAKNGNRSAERWLKANAQNIAIAYEEGRISD